MAQYKREIDRLRAEHPEWPDKDAPTRYACGTHGTELKGNAEWTHCEQCGGPPTHTIVLNGD